MLTFIKGEIDRNTAIVGNFNTPHALMDIIQKKIRKKTKALNDIIHQADLIDIYRTFHLKVSKDTFFWDISHIVSQIKPL